MKIPGAFNHGSNMNSSSLMDCERSINLRPESGQVGTPKEDAYSRRTPGLSVHVIVGTDPITCLHESNGRAYGISGTTFFEFYLGGTFVVRGTVAAATVFFPFATMCSNGTAGNQVFITSGGNGYIFNVATNLLTPITDLDFPNGAALMGEFFAGYFFVLVKNSRTMQWSALEDGTDWDALDVAERSWASDTIAAIKRNGTHIWVVGFRTSEVWYLTGGIEVFAPAQESLIEHGALASFSVALSAQGIICLEQDATGISQVILFRGLTPDTISTYAIAFEQTINADVLTNSVSKGFVIQIEGHEDYILQNSSGTFTLTPVFDISQQEWHHRAEWNSTACVWVPWRAQCHCNAFQKNFVGDRSTGVVYLLSMQNLTDELAVV